MAYSTTDRRRVYLACRAIFSGQNAQVRKARKVREIVEKRQATIPLVKDFGIAKVVEILRLLLENGVFQSDLKAKVEFPELFHSFPDRDAQRTVTEKCAAQSVAEALDEIMSMGGPADKQDNAGDIEDRELIPPAVKPLPAFEELKPAAEEDYPPSLYPSYFPYKAQHNILTIVQSTLEDCCFEFAKRWIPSVLDSKGWDCAEAVELTKWTSILHSHSNNLSPSALQITGPPLRDILSSAHRIRHTAVHRLPTTARGISQLVETAVNYTETLQDSVRSLKLDELHNEIDSKIKAMEMNKNALEDTVCQELDIIHQKREELDRKEAYLIEKMKKDDRENKALIGSLLEDSIRRIFSENEPQATMEDDEDNAGSRSNDEANGYAFQSAALGSASAQLSECRMSPGENADMPNPIEIIE
ncbi:uncharacterized protein CIMG_08080 [Coccidioides immitis RS]|uniref:Ubiquinol-cytochrome-c reductase cytochrome c1 n=1 Tax=Coccidioides immitis (strain RS) TaxID=246410 RepID=J3K4S2_COCIM|nr:uncharacterized protein CIMG_08080 [Coccidioides immitis RS]EAS29334.3 hypothetical protein CIMG_08080 [Coccidioides immitis RS]